MGKTTSAVNIAAAVGAKGKKVLLVDADPQGNATSGFGVNKRELKASTYDNIIGGKMASQTVVHTKYKVDIIPSSMDLAGAELELVDTQKRESKLRSSLAMAKGEYDYIFIDCPPALGLLTLNCLCAADTVIVPIQCEFYALEGLSQLMSTVRQIKRLYNPRLELEGVLLTMYDGRLNLTQQVVDEVKRFFPQKVFATVIPRNVRLSEAPSFGQPVMYYDASSRGSAAYSELADELLK